MEQKDLKAQMVKTLELLELAQKKGIDVSSTINVLKAAIAIYKHKGVGKPTILNEPLTEFAEEKITPEPIAKITPPVQVQENKKAESAVAEDQSQQVVSEQEAEVAIKDIYDGMLEEHHIILDLDKIAKQENPDPSVIKALAARLETTLIKMKTIASKEHPKIMRRYDIHKKNIDDLAKFEQMIKLADLPKILGEDGKIVDRAIRQYASNTTNFWKYLYDARTGFIKMNEEELDLQLKNMHRLAPENIKGIMEKIKENYVLQQKILMSIEESLKNAKKLQSDLAAESMKKTIKKIPELMTNAKRILLSRKPFLWHDENKNHVKSIPDIVSLIQNLKDCSEDLFRIYAKYHSFSQWLGMIDAELSKKIHNLEARNDRRSIIRELIEYDRAYLR